MNKWYNPPPTTLLSMKQNPEKPEPLGHGDHWQALGLVDDEIPAFLEVLLREADVTARCSTPWPDAAYSELVVLQYPQESLSFTTLCGISSEQKSLVFLTAFPVPTKTTEWLVEIEEILPSYGPYEGLVTGRAVTGHHIQWFAPAFHHDKDQWKPGALARVNFSAIALSIEPYPADPIILTEGPFVEQSREELRAEGKQEEADDPNFSITVHTDALRTFYSTTHDHHQFVGKILSATRICPRPEFTGWRLEIECLPDSPSTDSTLTLYAFSASLQNGYTPHKNDLVLGSAWLQGQWLADASPNDQILWHEESRKHTDN